MAPAKPPSDERHVLSAGRNLLDVCAATPPDPTQEAQVRFYLEHRRLRFLVPA
jgi:hypothetical protein